MPITHTNTTHSSLETDTWYLAASKPKQELRAVENLTNLGIMSYCPVVSVERLVRGKKSIKQEALFSGYLFIRLSVEDPNWHKVRSTRGIRDWVRFSGNVAKLPTGLIQDLINSEQAETEPRIVVNRMDKGQPVRVLSGPFAGLSAIFEQNDGEMRSMILVEFLGQINRLKVDNDQIAADR